MFQKILLVKEQLPYDHQLLKYVQSLKFLGAKDLTLAKHFTTQPERPHSTYSKRQIFEDIEALKADGFQVETMELHGLPSAQMKKILDYMEPFESLIMVGAQVSSLGKRIFDSEFAYELIQMPSKPILIVRIDEKEDDTFESIPKNGLHEKSHVLFPTDFSENAYHAFTYLEKMVEQGLKRVTLMHIQDIAKISPYLDYRILEFNQIDRDRLNALRERLEAKGDVHVDVLLEIGRPFREIMKTIEEANVDLLVLGRQGKGILRDIFIGSNSNNLARRANCSVLLIPREEEKK